MYKTHDGQTQFGRAMNELNITGICANTSSAKGHIERAQLALQYRLVKELRLRGISTPEATNALADEFMADYNRRFAKLPRHNFDVHRPFENNENLEATFTWREQRKVSKKGGISTIRNFIFLKIMKKADAFRGNALMSDCIRMSLLSSGKWYFPALHNLRGLEELDQGAIADNKRLGRALKMIKFVQYPLTGPAIP